MSEDTRLGLLEAAERILIQEGVHALSVRHIGAVSGINGTLVTYHFGNVAGLLAELCRLNLEPMLAEWDGAAALSGSRATLREVLAAWLGPLIRPAAFSKDGRALVVFDEIASHSQHEIRDELLHVMIALGARVAERLKPHLPHLGSRELRARVRFISAAALGPPPRVQLQPVPGQEPLDGIHFLMAFAEAGLRGRALSGRSADAQPATRGGLFA